MPDILVTKRDGNLEKLNLDKINSSAARACLTLEDVSPSEVVLDAHVQFYDKIHTTEIDKALILSARAKIEKEPNYSYVAARLLLNNIYKEVFGCGVEQELFEDQYRQSFIENVHELIEAGRLDERMAEFDLEFLASKMNLERDNLFKYLGIQTLYDRYFIHLNGVKKETPQAFFMRVAMGLSLNETKKNDKAVEFYDVLSQFLGMSSTPTLFNAGTTHAQLSSCFLSTIDDSLDSIMGSMNDQAKLSKYAGGLGVDFTPVRGATSYIKGTNGKSSGVIPFMKIFNDTLVAFNQSGLRNGSGCAYLEVWHVDFPDFLDVRKKTGDDRRRTHDMNTAAWVPDLFMEKVKSNEEWYLFSPDDVPDLHDLYGKEFEKRYAHYVRKAKAGKIKNFASMPAKELFKKIITSLVETGHPWMCFKDASNICYSNKNAGVIHSSNLCCMTADQRVPTDKGILTVKELFELQEPVKVVGRNKIEDASVMYMPKLDSEIVKILTSDGYEHKVTPDHKVWVKDYGWKETQNLRDGDSILTQQMEGLWGKEHNPELAFLTGMISGDGTFGNDGNMAIVDLWLNDRKLISEIEDNVFKLTGINSKFHPCNEQKVRLNSTELANILRPCGFYRGNKLKVPDFIWKGTKETVSQYLRGVYYCDASIQAIESNQTTIFLTSINKNWLKEIQILLSNFGIKTKLTHLRKESSMRMMPDGKGGQKEYLCQPIYRLLITGIRGCKILNDNIHYGEHKENEQFLTNIKKEGYQQKFYTKFIGLEKCENEPAYCLQVYSDEHSWTVNGLITKNTEILRHTFASEYDKHGEKIKLGETAVCNLASPNYKAHLEYDKYKGKWKLNKEKLAKTVTTLIRMLDNVIDLNYYTIPEARKSNMAHRPIGLGEMGFVDVLHALDIPYESEEAVELASELEEFITYHAIKASCALAKERGAFSTFEGSEWSEGNLPQDMFDKLFEERGTVKRTPKAKLSEAKWNALRTLVATVGVRNASIRAIAPTACVDGETLILTSDGLTRIKTLNKNNEKWQDINLNVQQENKSFNSNKFYINGKKPTKKITTKRGHQIKCTDNHRLRVISESGEYEWRYAKDLKIGDCLVRKLGGHEELLQNKAYEVIDSLENLDFHHNEKQDVKLPSIIDEDLAMFLGYYTGDGYVRDRDIGLVFYNEDLDLIPVFESILNKYNLNISIEDRPKGGVKVGHIFSKRFEKWFDANNFRKPAGNHGEGSFGAFIPDKVMKSKSSVLKSFLKGLYEAEGTITFQKTGSPNISISSVSESLMRDVQVCLEAFGIRGTLTKHGHGTFGSKDVYRVTLTSIKDCKLFIKEIGFISQRKKEKCDLVSSYEPKIEMGEPTLKNIVIIKDFTSLTLKLYKQNKTIYDYLVSCNSLKRINLNKAKTFIEQYPNELSNTKLGQILALGNLDFCEISDIQDNGEVETYDISVPENNTYIANGFVSHNTISYICGCRQSIEPDYLVLFTYGTLSGNFTMIDEWFVDKAKKAGIWSEALLDAIKQVDGDIGKLSLPENLKKQFKSAFRIDYKYLVDAAAARQQWIDMGQSFNIYNDSNSIKEKAEIYLYCYESGLKTTYYLRSKGASSVEKSTVTSSIEKEQSVCSIEAMKRGEECQSCQ